MTEVLTAGTVLTGSAAIPDGVVVVSERKIAWVGSEVDLPPEYAGIHRSNYPDSTIMPGMIDTHVHLAFDGGLDPVARMRAEDDRQQLVLMLHNASALLSAGVTTARDLGARSFLDVTVRDSIDQGIAYGPRMLVTGPPVTITGGHCWFMGGEADSLDDIRKIVRTHHREGVDLIKVMSSGGMMTKGSLPWINQYTDEHMKVIVDEARVLGMKVAAHAHGTDAVRLAVDAGVSTLEHCTFVNEDHRHVFDRELAVKIAAAGIFVCPTINLNAETYSERFGTKIGENLPEMKRLGISIVAGTDAGIVNTPHDEYAGGLEYLASLGFSNEEVIAMATRDAAEALGIAGTTGRLEADFDADLLVVDGDPRADISVVRRLSRIIARGRDYPVINQPR
ncbi:amidohydrolase family protein [Rhodococcus sp. IEGM 1379]|uniref:metal-dependent hydrolase family protein n=1 Tax=Rhodococcus sp. IEGM 1379 TaxID=3047086 RepID=UPI0024B6611D|nr:amidohydrolase family protein [Rhodococcus sp. IEGM 1379]MDI9914187.1 amidohydrolase family protein [Rhodococcus sp. IEGM 1379]